VVLLVEVMGGKDKRRNKKRRRKKCEDILVENI